MNKNIESQIAFEKLEMVINDTSRVLFAHVVLGLLIVFALSEEFESQSLWYWFSLNMFVMVLRFIHTYFFKKSSSVNEYSFHYKLFWLGLVLSACVWASTAFLFFPDSAELRLFLVICIAGLASGAISSTSQVFSYLVSFSTILLVPFILVYSLEATRISYFIAIALSSYIIFVLIVAKKNNKNIDSALRMGHKNELLVLELHEVASEAKEASEAKSTFLSTMSHEIRTPLNAILGYISILQKQETDETKKGHLDIVEHSSQFLLGVINNILDFNKINTNNLTLEMHSSAIEKELHNSMEFFLPICHDKGVNLDWKIDTNIPKYISTDFLRLNQIISNLVSNAIKFTPVDKNIILNAEFRDDRIYFRITDEGIGIDTSKQELIFESFKQADESTSRQFGGTGLGLSISSKLVKLFGSELEVESSLGKGSTFSFSIPAEVSEIQEDMAEFTAKVFNGEKVLVAEDNKTNQMLIEILLEEMNLKADIANDGVEAVRAYKDNYPLILMDINMPNMNGEEAMKHIKKEFPKAKIIALTANALSEDKQRYLDMGFDDYLSKPIDTQALNIILSEMI